MRFRVAVLWLAALVLLPSLCAASESTNASIWVVEPGAQPPQWFGHILLCFDDAGPDASNADCYNFGALASQQKSFLADFLEGRAEYRTEVSPAVRVSARYRNEHRAIERLPINATPKEVQRLRELVDREFPAEVSYLYRPFRDNCTTRLVSALRYVLGPTWPHSIGRRIDHEKSPRLQLDELLDREPIERAAIVLVTDSVLGELDSVREESAVFLPSQFTGREPSGRLTPTTLWRMAFIGVFVLGGVALGRRRGRACIAGLLGSLALVVWIARFRGGMPEMSQNLAWLLYCPLDFCLQWEKSWVRSYILVRIVGVISLVVASLGGLIDQSVYWPALAIAAGLCTVTYSAYRDTSRDPRPMRVAPRKAGVMLTRWLQRALSLDPKPSRVPDRRVRLSDVGRT